jgi:hypothetical protein
MTRDRSENIFNLEAEFLGFYDELLNLRTEQLGALGISGFRKRSDRSADSRLCLQ